MEILLIFFLGLEFGSFANVCIYRWPRGQSILSPARSHCPWCDAQISWWENIPIFSWFFLRGKCSHCRSEISLRYPLVELALPAIWVAGVIAIRQIGVNPSVPFLFCLGVLFFVLLTTSLCDLDWRIIPDELSLTLIVVGVLTSFWNPFINDGGMARAFLSSLLGMMCGALPIWLLGITGKSIFGKESMGGGDVKLMAGIGSVLGWESSLAVLIYASFLGVGAVGVGLVMKILKRNEYIPFGPFLSVGTLVEFFLSATGYAFHDILKKIP